MVYKPSVVGVAATICTYTRALSPSDVDLSPPETGELVVYCASGKCTPYYVCSGTGLSKTDVESSD